MLAAVLLSEEKSALFLKPFVKVGQVALTMYSLQFILAWVLMLIDIDPTSIAQFPMGDIATVVLVLTAAFLLSLWKNGPLESAIRKFEEQFYMMKGVSNGATD